MSEKPKSLNEAAEILGLHRQTVWQHYKSGRLPNAYIVGSSIAIPTEDLDKLADYLRMYHSKKGHGTTLRKVSGEG